MGATVRGIVFVVGLALVVGTMESVFTTLVVPRVSSARLLRVISTGLAAAALRSLRVVPRYETKDRLLGIVGPLGMVSLFVTWLGLLVVGFGLMMWWTSGTSLAHSVAAAASSVVTLGVITIPQGGTEVLEFVAGGTGLLAVALGIAYLPALYTAFAAREAEVTLLATRAGEPAWGPELLARHHRFVTMEELPALYAAWERWAAAVAESHTNYPTLLWLRSPVPWRSWLTALVAVLDAAALHDAVAPQTAPRQARLCLQVGTNCLRSVASALRVAFDPDPRPTDPVRLTFDEYMEGVDRLQRAGLAFERTPLEAWRHFRGWRVNYEPIADALTAILVPPPAPWFPERPWLGKARYPRVLDRTPDDPEATTPRT